MKPDTFYMLDVAAVKPLKEQKRRKEAVMTYLKASGHKYLKRVNAFATREDAEQMILRMGFPYEVTIHEASWAF
jgi:hypothetical protein